MGLWTSRAPRWMLMAEIPRSTSTVWMFTSLVNKWGNGKLSNLSTNLNWCCRISAINSINFIKKKTRWSKSIVMIMMKKNIMVCVMQQGGSLGSWGLSGFFCSFKMILELVGFLHKKLHIDKHGNGKSPCSIGSTSSLIVDFSSHPCWGSSNNYLAGSHTSTSLSGYPGFVDFQVNKKNRKERIWS